MRVLVWLLRALVFFVLFAFALNNQHEVELHWFFGLGWRAPMVFIVLAAFVMGLALGAVAMLPSWWRQRRRASRATKRLDQATASATSVPPPRPATATEADPPVRPDGL